MKADIGGEGNVLTIPISIAPRYGTGPSDLSSQPTATSGDGLSVTVNVSTSVPLRRVECRTHPISIDMCVSTTPILTTSFSDLASPAVEAEYNPNKARATLSDRTAIPKRDFVLHILTAGSTLLASQAILEPPADGSKEWAMMVTPSPHDLFATQVSTNNFDGEIIFIADRSGSMGGSKIKTRRDEIAVFLKSLPEKCRFNIYSFGSSFSSLWETSQT